MTRLRNAKRRMPAACICPPLSSESEQISKSRPDSGRGLSQFPCEKLENLASCFLLARQRLMEDLSGPVAVDLSWPVAVDLSRPVAVTYCSEIDSMVQDEKQDDAAEKAKSK